MQRLLIVDDEQKVCECLQRFFSEKGYDASCASTGEEAIERFMRQPPDVVLLDIRLPGISGLEVLKRARDLCPATKVIMVTGSLDEGTEETAKVYGARAYITKPFDFSEITWEAVFSDSPA